VKKIFSKLSIKIKIILFVLISLIFLVLTGLIGYLSLDKSIESVQNLTKVEYPKVLLVQKLKADNHALMRFLWTTHGLYQYAGERKNQMDEARASFKALENDMISLRAMKFDTEIQKIVIEIEKRWKDLSSTIPKILDTYEKGTEVADKEATNVLAFEAVAQANEVYDFLKDFDIKLQNRILEETKINEAKFNQAKMIIISSIVVGFIILIIVGVIFASNLSKKLLDVAQNIHENSQLLYKAAITVSDSSKSLNEDSTKQASAMTETSSSMVELNSMIAMNSENAGKSLDVSSSNKDEVVESQNILGKVIGAIQDVDEGNQALADQVEQNNQKLEDVVKIILDINSKTAVINDIVFQIKLLSFNASVEAARAGEHGKGFSVVAEEVGNLAQNTSKAALEITELLNSSVAHVKKIAVETSEQIAKLVSLNKVKVSNCINFSKECDDYLKKVLNGSEEMNRMAKEISASSSEQATGMDEISKAMNQLSDVFQNSQKLSSENQESAEILYREVESLNQEITHLNTIVNGEA
jgi:methyl-accepting chemotaxis protein